MKITHTAKKQAPQSPGRLPARPNLMALTPLDSLPPLDPTKSAQSILAYAGKMVCFQKGPAKEFVTLPEQPTHVVTFERSEMTPPPLGMPLFFARQCLDQTNRFVEIRPWMALNISSQPGPDLNQFILIEQILAVASSQGIKVYTDNQGALVFFKNDTKLSEEDRLTLLASSAAPEIKKAHYSPTSPSKSFVRSLEELREHATNSELPYLQPDIVLRLFNLYPDRFGRDSEFNRQLFGDYQALIEALNCRIFFKLNTGQDASTLPEASFGDLPDHSERKLYSSFRETSCYARLTRQVILPEGKTAAMVNLASLFPQKLMELIPTQRFLRFASYNRNNISLRLRPNDSISLRTEIDLSVRAGVIQKNLNDHSAQGYVIGDGMIAVTMPTKTNPDESPAPYPFVSIEASPTKPSHENLEAAADFLRANFLPDSQGS